jgi:6-phosphogluconolactonase
MQLLVSETPEILARDAAWLVAKLARETVARRKAFAWAVSGGRTPWAMLAELATLDVPWPAVTIYQVDERSAPEGHTDRNLTHLEGALLDKTPLKSSQIIAMPVNQLNLNSAAQAYSAQLVQQLGSPPVFDLVHLGLGADGHTASLLPGDPVLDVQGADVSATGVYQGRRRMTLTYPAINRARQIVWLVEGESKREMLARLLAHDETIPAGKVEHARATVMADRAAAGK